MVVERWSLRRPLSGFAITSGGFIDATRGDEESPSLRHRVASERRPTGLRAQAVHLTRDDWVGRHSAPSAQRCDCPTGLVRGAEYTSSLFRLDPAARLR